MNQLSLFEDDGAPQTLRVVPDIISEAEEHTLLKRIETIAWQKVEMHGVVAKRAVAHYGLDYTYTKRAVRETVPPPAWLDFLTARVAKLLDHPADAIKEVLVTAYPAGAGIGWHKDAEVFGNAIVGVSLLSDCTMKFRHPETKVVYKLEIPRRSAYIFADEARWTWHHSIASHRERRVSITFRTLAEKRGRLDIPSGQI